MKRRKLLYFLPLIGLLLSGCDVKGTLLSFKDSLKNYVITPTREFFDVSTSDSSDGEQKPSEKEEDNKPSEEDHSHEEQTPEQPVHEHTLKEGWEKDETYHWHECTECEEILDKAEHSWDTGKVTVEATCTTEGVFTYTCTICEATKTEVIAAQHDASGEWISNEQSHWKVCPKCNEKILEAEHAWGEANHIKLPTKFESGLDEYTCEICLKTKQVEVEKLSDMNLNVLIVGTALLRGSAEPGFNSTFAGLCNDMDSRTMNVTLDSSLTPGSGYTFKSLAGETTLGNTFRTALAENDYDVIVLQVTRQIAKGHDSVAASEKSALKSIEELLKSETSQIYLLTYPSDNSYNVYDVDENGDYVKGEKDTTTGAKANSHYYFEVAQDMATDIDAKVCNYAESYISLEENMERHNLTSPKVNLVNYLRAVCLYESMFNKQVTDESSYQNETNLSAEELHYVRRYAAEYCLNHEHVLSNTVLFDSEYHWQECEICNHKDHIDSHTLVKEDATYVPASCTHEGHAHFTCTGCGYTKDETYDQLEHQILDPWIEDGDTHYQACETCDGKFNVESHTWNGGVITTQPTHLAYGQKTYTCTKCGATKVEQVDKLTEHTFGAWTNIDATTHTRTCECGESETENHTWNEGVKTKDPTFTEEGEMTYTCTKCGATKTEAIPVIVHTEHTADSTWHKDSDYHWHVCTFEGCNEVLDKAAHSWDEGVVTTQPTHLAFGERTYTCSVCGQTKVEQVAKLTDHTFGAWTNTDANTHTRTCECGETETENHTWNAGEITTVPTRTSDGEKTYRCTKCGATKTEVVEKVATNVLMLGTANMNNYNMDVHLSGIAQDEGYKPVTTTYLTTGTQYSFRKLLDTSSGTSFGSQLLTLLDENDFDVIILSMNRMTTKGSDDVIAAEDEYLETLAPILLAETDEIYLMSFNMTWGSTPSVYTVSGSGTYSSGSTSGYDDKETSYYFDTLGAQWATQYGFGLIKYSSCYMDWCVNNGNKVCSDNVVTYMQGVILYNSVFNKLLNDSTQYHKQISSTYTDKTAKNIRTHTVNYSTYQA